MLNNIAYEMIPCEQRQHFRGMSLFSQGQWNENCCNKNREFKVIQNIKFSLNRETNMSRKSQVIIR